VASTPFPWWRQQYSDANGNPYASGTLEFYESGTSTPLAVYTNQGLTVSAGTTVTLNSAGCPQVAGNEVTLYPLPRAYRVILKNSAGVTIRDESGIYANQAAAAGNLEIDGTAGVALSAGDWAYESDGSGGLVAGRWYKADADLYYGSIHPNLAFVPTAIASGATGTLRVGGVADNLAGLAAGTTYYLSGTAGAITATAPANARSVGVAKSATAIDMMFSPRWLTAGPPFVCDGRLTLTTNVPVTTGDVTAATTLYWTPYKGNRVALFDGSQWKTYAFSQLSIAVPSTTVKMYDVWVYDNAGTLTLELTAWTNDTTRATALTTQDGVYVKTGALTRRYLGSVRTTGSSGNTEDSLAKRYVWNYYNRVPRPMRVIEATNSWSYSTTLRQANGSAANQLDFVVGVAEVQATISVVGLATSSASGYDQTVAIGQDSAVAAMAGQVGMTVSSISTGSAIQQIRADVQVQPAVGRHYYAWLEYSSAGAGGQTTTWYGDNGGTIIQSGIYGSYEG
jgi:hypothetical protein